jgi:hypothetical protein
MLSVMSDLGSDLRIGCKNKTHPCIAVMPHIIDDKLCILNMDY